MKATILFFLIVSFTANMPKVFTNKYYDNGKKMACGWLKADKKVGFWEFFYEDGHIKSKGHFLNDLKDGYWTTYHFSNKNRKTQGNYINNKKSGYWYYYNSLGEVTKKGHYDNDKPVRWWKYYSTNQNEKCIYQPDGKTRYCLIYIDGKLQKGSKYINDTLMNEWNSISKFKLDNPDFSF